MNIDFMCFQFVQLTKTIDFISILMNVWQMIFLLVCLFLSIATEIMLIFVKSIVYIVLDTIIQYFLYYTL